MAKPRHPSVRRFVPKGSEAGGVATRAAAGEAGKVGGTQGGEAAAPTPVEGETSGRSATGSHRVGMRNRKRMTTRKGAGKERPQGGHK